MEETTLIEVKNDFSSIHQDKRLPMSVDPRDITTAIHWLPTTLLEIAKTDIDPLFNLCVRAHGTNEEIRASWR